MGAHRGRRAWVWRWLLAVTAAAYVMLPVHQAPAQTSPTLELSSSCLAVNERIPALQVWGTNFDSWLAAKPGNTVTIEWHWGGEPSTPAPATVNPQKRVAPGGSFTMSFDVTGKSAGLSSFSAVVRDAQGNNPTLVASADLEIKTSCPTGSATCSVDQGAAVMLVQVTGYPTTWTYSFYYQYHLPHQTGPVTGAAAPDGSVRGQFKSPPQDNPALVTAHIVRPQQGDTSSKVFDVSFSAPVCQPPTTTTPTASTTTTAPTTTTRPTSSTAPTTSSPTTAGTATTTPVPTSAGATSTSVPTATTAPSGSSNQPAAQPVLTLNPPLGPAGFVTMATGSGLPPNTDVVVSWQGVPGSVPAHTDGSGTFTVGLLVLPHNQPGQRQAVIVQFPTAVASFLVVPGTVRPPTRDGKLVVRG